MSTRRLVRRVAAVSTITLSGTFLAAGMSAFEGNQTSIQRVQYQPGQPTPPASGVTAELQKMFDESGQPMPSMRPQDLPNAQGQQMNMVRPTGQPAQQTPAKPTLQQPTGSTAATPKSATPPKRNFLQKFADKLTGEDKRRKEAEARVVPPVPPGYQEPASRPSQATANNTPRSQAGTPATQNQTGHRTAASNPGSAASRPSTNNAVRQNQTAQPVPRVPTSAQQPVVRSTTVPQNRSGANTGAAVTNPQFVQPGAAPGFMQPRTGTPAVSAATAQSGGRTATPAQQPLTGEPPAAPPVDDTFVDPFNESPLVDNEQLDLDALVKPAVANEQTGQDIDAAQPDAARQPVTSVLNEEGLELPTADAFPPTGLVTGESAESAATDVTADAVEENPFTGVQLPEAELPEAGDMFIPNGQALPAADPIGSMFADEEASDTSATASGSADAAIPMSDFGAELPAISLPPVDDVTASAASDAPVPAPIELPAPLDVSEPAQDVPLTIPSEGSVTTSETNATPTTPAQAPILTAPEPLQTVDAERLQQAAEQERRLRQQRQILSRAGQTGFKGFCPVALRDRRELVDASSEFTAAFGLQSYSFSSLDAKLAFESDPARYAPAAGGSDVVQLVNTGEEHPGTLDYALWHRDRLYLFQSRESMSTFARDPQRFASQY